MVELEEVVHKLNAELDIEAFGIDSAFKRYITDVWQTKIPEDYRVLFKNFNVSNRNFSFII